LGTAASDNPKTCLENVDTTNQSKWSGLKKYGYSKPKYICNSSE